MDPFLVLDLNHSATDETIRVRYLELVRRFPPETQPERFQVISAAYEAIRTEELRLDYLFPVRSKAPTSTPRQIFEGLCESQYPPRPPENFLEFLRSL